MTGYDLVNFIFPIFSLCSISPQDVFFSDDTQQPPIVSDQSLSEAKFPEHVHNCLHGGLRNIKR